MFQYLSSVHSTETGPRPFIIHFFCHSTLHLLLWVAFPAFLALHPRLASHQVTLCSMTSDSLHAPGKWPLSVYPYRRPLSFPPGHTAFRFARALECRPKGFLWLPPASTLFIYNPPRALRPPAVPRASLVIPLHLSEWLPLHLLSRESLDIPFPSSLHHVSKLSPG